METATVYDIEIITFVKCIEILIQNFMCYRRHGLRSGPVML